MFMKYIGLWFFAVICFLFLGSQSSFAQTDGYLSSLSVAQGEKLRFYISTPAPSFDLKIYKLGLFKKEIATFKGVAGGLQKTDDSAFINGCNWKVTKEITIPYSWA